MFLKNKSIFIPYRKFLMSQQFTIGFYNINLYFPEHKVSIKCNEYNHKDRDINDQINLQNIIEN